MAYSPNQPRDANGKFSSGSGVQRAPVKAHVGRKSVGTHASASGYSVYSFNQSAQRFEPTLNNKRRAVAERVALRKSADEGRGTAAGFSVAVPSSQGAAANYFANRRAGRLMS